MLIKYYRYHDQCRPYCEIYNTNRIHSSCPIIFVQIKVTLLPLCISASHLRGEHDDYSLSLFIFVYLQYYLLIFVRFLLKFYYFFYKFLSTIVSYEDRIHGASDCKYSVEHIHLGTLDLGSSLWTAAKNIF